MRSMPAACRGSLFLWREKRGLSSLLLLSCFCEELKMQLQLLLCASTLPPALIALEEGLHPPLWTRKQRLR